MSETDRLLERARERAGAFGARGLGGRPSRRVAVLACMDARVNPYGLLGLSEGEAHVIRNAGGVVTEDAIRSLAISQHLMGTEEIVLIHHTDCGMTAFTDEELEQRLVAETGRRPGWRAHAFADLEQDVRDGMARLEASPFIRAKESIRGFVLDVETGELHEVA